MADLELRWNARELRRLHDATGPIAHDLARRGQNVVVAAQALAPVLTGRTQSGIVSDVNVDATGDPYVDIMSTAVNDKLFPYPLVHEFGDEPFLRPSIQAARR